MAEYQSFNNTGLGFMVARMSVLSAFIFRPTLSAKETLGYLHTYYSEMNNCVKYIFLAQNPLYALLYFTAFAGSGKVSLCFIF